MAAASRSLRRALSAALTNAASPDEVTTTAARLIAASSAAVSCTVTARSFSSSGFLGFGARAITRLPRECWRHGSVLNIRSARLHDEQQAVLLPQEHRSAQHLTVIAR